MTGHLMQQDMENSGLHPAEPIIADGVFRRIDDRDGKARNKLIGYVCYETAGYYCHWSKLPEGRKWSVKSEVEFTPEEKRDYAIKMQKAIEARKKAEEQRHKECKERSVIIWAQSPVAPNNHPYLVKKSIEANGMRVYKDRLTVPVRNICDELMGLQYITCDFKWFEDGTPVKGNFSYILGDNSKPFYICEGFATAATIHQATGATVFIAFSCGNLLPAAEAIRANVGADKTIVICADDDRLTAGNPGLTHATAAATAINAGLAVPTFPGDKGTDFNDLSSISGIDAVTAILKTSAPSPAPVVDKKPQRYELRPYQKRALQEIRQAIAAAHHSIMIQSPTGSGKGVMLSDIINRCHEKGSTVLFLVHRQEILYQVSAYLNHFGIEHGIIKSGEVHEDHHPVQLASFQTITRRLQNPFIRQADVIIVDEAHHATAATYLRVIEQFKKKVVLGFSATPSRQNGVGLGNLFDKMIQVATIKELTDLGYLAPVRAFAPVVPDLTGVKVTAGDYNAKQLESAMNQAGLIGDIVGHWQKYGDDRKTMVFATGVQHSVALCKQFHAAGITAAHVDGTTPKEDRDSILDRFKSGSIQVIVNCMIFTEGVDVPDIGCVILARPTKSLPMYMQMVGRGMRAVPGKTDCILLDHAGAIHEHGFPDEITEWELSSTCKTINQKQAQRKKKESEPIGCPVCDLLYTGQLKCPGCGNIPTMKQIGKDIEYIDGTLGEIVRKSTTRKAEPSSQVKADWYRQLKKYATQHGYNPGWVSHKFREKFGVWPNKYTNLPPAREVSAEVLGYIRHCHIKRAKSELKAA